MSLFAGDPSAHAQAPARAPLDPAAIEVVDPLYPGFTEILERDDAVGLVTLARTLSDHPSPASLAVLLWMLRYCPSWPQEHVTRLPFAELAEMLRRAEPDRKALIAELFGKGSTLRTQAMSPADRDRIIAALIECLDIAHVRLRTQAVSALGRVGAAQAVGPIVVLLDQPDADRYQMSAIGALAGIGTREAVLTLERLARSGTSHVVREAAAGAYIRAAHPPDPGAQVRRLLWEQPDTALEQRVLTEGRAALPAVWQALARGSVDDRRTAAALLDWFRDVRSIEPTVGSFYAWDRVGSREIRFVGAPQGIDGRHPNYQSDIVGIRLANRPTANGERRAISASGGWPSSCAARPPASSR